MKECRIGDVFAGLGQLLTGVAACAAVWVAKDPVTNYFSKVNQTQTQTQTFVINPCDAKKTANNLIQNSSTPTAFAEHFKQIPSEPPKNSSQPIGLFIAPEFREVVKQQFETASTPKEKQQILKTYWEKSISKETKAKVELNLNGDQ